MQYSPQPSGQEIDKRGVGLTVDDRSAEVRQHLTRILESPSFQGSKRCQEFLRYVVDRLLAGQQDSLKERVIGADVFGRATAYDTSSDAIVRVKANEVRKRLAQFYQDGGGSEEIRIELPAGSYVPNIVWLDSAAIPRVTDKLKPPASPRLHQGGWTWYAAGVAVLLVAAATLWRLYPHQTELERFWAPILASPEPVVMCMSVRDDYIYSAKMTNALSAVSKSEISRLDLALERDDVVRVPYGQMSLQSLRAVLDIGMFLTRYGKQTQFRTPADVSFDEVRHRAVVLLGSFYNPWAMQLNQDLRYRFDFTGQGSSAVSWIRDSKAPNERKWAVDKVWPYHPQPVDYAIISRVFDSSNQAAIVYAAGMSRFGAQVAGDFLTTPRYWRSFTGQAPAGWERMNCQIIIETKVIGTTPGPPRIAALHFW